MLTGDENGQSIEQSIHSAAPGLESIEKNLLLNRSSEDGPDCEMTMRYFMYGHGLGNLSVSFKVVIVYRSCFKVFLYMVNDGSFNDFQNHGHCDG